MKAERSDRSRAARLLHRISRRWIQPAALLAAAAGCVTSPSRFEPQPPPEPASGPTPAPTWLDDPLSWQKLNAIEQWLDSPGARADPAMAAEAELQLAEGRLEFSERDARRSSAPRDSLAVRLHAAEQSFDDLLDRGSLTPAQRARAEIGRRRALALLGSDYEVGLRILTREEWGARPAVPSRLTPLRGAWSRITVHHSAETSSTDQGGDLADSEDALRHIQKFHMDSRTPRFGDIGYHFLIDAAGRIFEGRELTWQGAHAGGRNNYQNIGICLLGDFSHQRPSDAALASLRLLLDDLRQRYAIPRNRVYAHRDLSSTACPGDWTAKWVHAYSRSK